MTLAPLPFFAFQSRLLQLSTPVRISSFIEAIIRFGSSTSFTHTIFNFIFTLLALVAMRSTTLLAGLIALTSTAFAASSDECQAQNIVDACVEGYTERIKRCQDKSNDWICMCDVYRDVLTCYNNCPNSNEKPPVQNQVTQFCTAAEP